MCVEEIQVLYIPEMLGIESKVLMVERVELLVLRHGTVVFTRPILVTIVDVELLKKAKKKTFKLITKLASNLYLREKRARNLLLSF